MTTIINFFGTPSSGKTTLAANFFSYLKKKNYSVDMTREFARELIYEGRLYDLADQVYVMSEHWRRIRTLIGKVKYIICDSPILLSAVYASPTEVAPITTLAAIRHNQHQSINFLLKPPEFVVRDGGRIHDEKNTKELFSKIVMVLEGCACGRYYTIDKNHHLEELENWLVY